MRQLRMLRAEKRYAAPVWRTYFHPKVIMAAMVRAQYPDAKYVVFPDDGTRN